MKKHLLSITILVVFPLQMVHAASEYATFASFYRESLNISPWSVLFVAALTIGGAIAILSAGVTTGGAGAPVAAIAVGTWIGKLLGFSGAVATNVGLALLGGGSIASGGLGMAGGAMLISTSLNFSTAVVLDYAVPRMISEYNYKKLEDLSKNMPTIPLPVNNDGSSSYRAALDALRSANSQEPYFTDENRAIIERSIKMIEGGAIAGADTPEGVAREKTLLSLLYFVSNDNYVENASRYAEDAIWNARISDVDHTLPAFILAASSAYDETFDFYSMTEENFRYSILREPDNPLIPLLFSIYLDRISLRFEDDYLSETALDAIYEIMKEPALRHFRLVHYQIVMKRYFVQLKLNQQKISSLCGATNRTILDSPFTLSIVEEALLTYRELLESASDVVSALNQLDESSEPETRIQILADHDLLERYRSDERRLSELAAELRNRHPDIKTDATPSSRMKDDPIAGGPIDAIGADELWYGYDADKHRFKDRAITVFGIVSYISDDSLYLDVRGKDRINCDTDERLSPFIIGQSVVCKGVVEYRLLGRVWIGGATIEALEVQPEWFPITAEELWDGYSANKYRFRGRPIAVSGVVSEIGKNSLHLDVRGKDGISCDADDGAPEARIGDLVTCYGLVDYKMLGTVMVDNSRIEVIER